VKGKAWLRRWLIFVIALIMGMTSVPGVYAHAGEQTDNSVQMAESNRIRLPPAVVDGEVYDEFGQEGTGTYIVKLREQSDVEAAAKLAKSYSALSGETSAKRKLTVRSFVLNDLKETADRTQAGISEELEAGLQNGSVQDYRSFYIVNAIAVTSTREVMERLAAHPAVERITPNRKYMLEVLDKGQAVPDTGPSKADGAGEPAQDWTGGADAAVELPWNLRNLNVGQAWDKGFDGMGVVVANMDSGVDLDHPALKRKWRGYNAQGQVDRPELSWYDATPEKKKLPFDGNAHGTHVMGTMVGSEPDGTNPIGVAPQAKWIAARIFNSAGEATDAGILAAGEWILAPTDDSGRAYPELAPDIVNNSWGNVQAGKNEFFQDIVRSWRSAGIVPVFAAGNTRPPYNYGGPGSITPPGNYPESFAVGAVNSSNRLADFSLQGPSPYGQMKPEVSAPGVSIRSSVPGGSYALMNGTSMAAPHVAGVAALLLQANHSLTVDQVEKILKDTAIALTDNTFPQSPNNGYGSGIVNALNAVSTQQAGLGELEGAVTVDGEDDEEPVIEHQPLTLVFNALDQEISARIMDDISVTRAELEVKKKGEQAGTAISMVRMSGDYRDGIYEGIIPSSMLDTAGIEYRIRAVDFGGNEKVSAWWPVEVSEGVKLGYAQDFETDIEGYGFGGEPGIWEWGVPTSGPGKAGSGSKVMATRLDGNYPTGAEEAYFVMPLIDLRDSEHTILSFKHWHKLGSWYSILLDKAEVFIGRESRQFEFELAKQFDGKSGDWKTDYIDLSPYKGDRIFVLFNLRGAYGSDEGWYVDDIELIGPTNLQPDAPKVKARSNAPGKVILEWEQEPQGDVKEYVIYRSPEPGGSYAEIGVSTGRNFADHPLPQQGTYFYIAKARTYSHVLSEASNEVSWTFTGGELIYGEDFEGGDRGWTREGEPNEWEHGVPDPKYGPPQAVSGKNVIGTNFAGYVSKNTNQSIISPEIDLTGAKHASFYFQQWYDLEDGDKGYVEISEDGGAAWQSLAAYPKPTYNTNHPKRFWYMDEIDIGKYAGKKVHIRFRLKTGGASLANGWYLDDIQVRDTLPVKTFIPAGTEAKPAEEAGTGAAGKEEQATSREAAAKKAPTAPSLSAWRSMKQETASLQTADGEGKRSSGLPAAATVTIVETDRSTKTDSGTGRYRLTHPPGTYTMRVEAYGYHTAEQTVTIHDRERTEANIHLQPLSSSTISGVITDKATGEPIAGAAVRVREDAHVPTAVADEQGNYTLEVYAGDYTLLVSARGYWPYEQQIRAEGAVTNPIALKSFRGTEDELAYDRGEGDNAVAFYSSGNGYAVRMTSDGPAQVTGARMFFWADGWPVPGGTAFRYALYDASGPDGQPGGLLSGPHAGTARLDGEWTELSFSNGPFVDGDFYVAYIQDGAYPDVPGLAVDEEGINHGRSWRLEDGTWTRAAASQGNYMIRARITHPDPAQPVAKITVEPRDIRLYEGQQLQLHVKAEDEDGNERDVTALSAYAADGEQVIEVNAEGLITARSAGEATVKATYEGLEDTVRVTVSPAPDIPEGEIRSIAVHPPELALKEGEASQLTVTAAVYSEGKELTVPLVKGLVFRSQDAGIAAVDEAGRVTGLQAGETKVTVSYGELEAVVPVTVRKSDVPPTEEVRSIHVQPEELALKAGESAQLTVTAAVYAAGEVKRVPITEGLSFTSSNPQVARAEAGGRIAALREGEARIHIVYGALKTEALVKVKGADIATPPATRPDPPSSASGSGSSSNSSSSPASRTGTPIRADGRLIGTLYVTDGQGGKQARVRVASDWLEKELDTGEAGAPVALDLSSLSWKEYTETVVEVVNSSTERLAKSGKALLLKGLRFALTVPAEAIPDFIDRDGLKLTLSVQASSSLGGARQALVSGDTAALVSDIIGMKTPVRTQQAQEQKPAAGKQQGAGGQAGEPGIGSKSAAWNVPLLLELELDKQLVRHPQAAGIYGRHGAESWGYAGLPKRIANEPGKKGTHVLTVPVRQPGEYAGLEYAKTFADIAQHWGRAKIEALASHHVVSGRNDTRFGPNDPVTQAEFMTLLDRITGKEPDWKRRSGEPGAHEALRREEMIVLLVTALHPELPQPPAGELDETALEQVSPEARAAVAYAYQTGWVKGMGAGGFAGDALTTRAQVAVLLYRVLEQMGHM